MGFSLNNMAVLTGEKEPHDIVRCRLTISFEIKPAIHKWKECIHLFLSSMLAARNKMDRPASLNSNVFWCYIMSMVSVIVCFATKAHRCVLGRPRCVMYWLVCHHEGATAVVFSIDLAVSTN